MEEFNTDWWSDRKESLTKKDIEDIIVYFKKKGYYISKKGIIHQWFGWKNGLGKSYYRGRGYYLFTPSGYNPFCIVLKNEKLDQPSFYV